MVSTALIHELQHMVSEMMKDKHAEKDYKIEIEGQTGSSDGYLGDIIFFNVSKSEEKQLNLVLKTAKRNQTLRTTISEAEVYDRELAVYSDILPLVSAFLKEKNLNGFLNFIPKSYFTKKVLNEESIILENLKYQNFALWNCKKPMDKTHIKIVLENYGKWHGLTMAFKDQKPDEFLDIVKHWQDLRAVLSRQFGVSDMIKNEFQIIMKMLGDCGRSDLVNIYKEIENQIDDVIERRTDEKDFLCITHGDGWTNNFMFKYEDPNELKPSRVCFLDFQLSMFDSPVVDISFFFYGVADKTAYYNFDNYLTTYYNSLSSSIKSLGSDPEKIFSMRDLKKHWRKHAFYGVLHSIILMKIQLCEPYEAPDLNKMAETGESLNGCFSFESRNTNAMRQREMDVFIHFGELLKFNRI